MRDPRNWIMLPDFSADETVEKERLEDSDKLSKTESTVKVTRTCGNFSDTSSLKFLKTKGSIGHAFTVCIHTENQNQRSFYPSVLHEISVLIELLLGHLCYRLTDVPPQPNSPPDFVSRAGR